MSDELTMAETVRSAATNVCDSAEILGESAQDDGSHIITLRVESETCDRTSQVRDMDEFKWGNTDDGTPTDDGADERSADAKAEAENRKTGWDSISWANIQRIAKITERKTTRQRPDEMTKENLTEYLEAVGITPKLMKERCEGVESDENDENDTSGKVGDGSEGAESEDSAPEHPDDAENPGIENYKFWFGECAEPDCTYGAKSEELDRCRSCHDKSETEESEPETTETEEYEKMTWEVEGEELTYNALQSRAADITKVQPSWTGDKLADVVRNSTEGADRGSEVQKVQKMFDTSPKVAEEAIEAVEDGHFGNHKDAVEHLEA